MGQDRRGNRSQGRVTAPSPGIRCAPGTDDMPEAPSIPLVTGLLDMGAMSASSIRSAWRQVRHELCDVACCDDAYACADGADVLVIVTKWVQFRALTCRA